MKMKNDLLFSVILGCAAAAGLAAPACAQSDPGTTPAKQTSASKTDKPPKIAPLAHANSVDDADKKIAWEERDIQGQEEFIDRIQQELGQAPPDRKEHLQKVIEEHKQILADTRKELEGLKSQRKQLEKPGAPNVTASAQPPQ